jgi:DNA-binding transcriptional regulator WhiA
MKKAFSRKEYLEKYELVKKLYATGNYKLIDLEKITGLWYGTISEVLKKAGFKVNPNGKKDINSDVFEKIDTEEKAYWLGFLYADGSLYKNKKGNSTFELTLKESDLLHIEKFKDFVQSKHSIKYRKNTKAYRIMFGDNKFFSDLVKLGCTERKSLTLKFPTKEQVPNKYLKDFIRGYFDGDGSFNVYNTKNRKNCVLSLLGTKEFLKGIQERTNIPVISLHKDKRHSDNTYFISYSGNFCYQILQFLYEDSKVYLDRKYQIYCKIKNMVEKKEILDWKNKNSKNDHNLIKLDINVE